MTKKLPDANAFYVEAAESKYDDIGIDIKNHIMAALKDGWAREPKKGCSFQLMVEFVPQGKEPLIVPLRGVYKSIDRWEQDR